MMAADPHLYRITYDNGKIKHGNRQVLGCVVGAANSPGFNYRTPVKIERAPEPEWEDVTAEHLPAKDG
jgi:hypothetical protein